MPAQLIAYVSRAFGKQPHPTAAPVPSAEIALKKVFILLRSQTGHDFSLYKSSTIHRRIERRMAVHQIENLEGYIKYLQQTTEEVEALFRDLLIGVTSFFRDAHAFKALEEMVIPILFTNKDIDHVFRVWVPGCATGEEAYSLAILLQEQLEVQKRGYRVQIFATDIDSQAITTARAGLYPASIANDNSPERLARFFTAVSDGSAYRVHKGIRDMLIFSEQDVIKDPPFSKLDLISCRNLLIYMGGDLQKKLIPLFHYSLNPQGFLFLGTSETVGDFGNLFATLDRKNKLYQRKEDSFGAQRIVLNSILLPKKSTDGAGSDQRFGDDKKLPLRELTEQGMLQQFGSVGMLINSRGDILYLHGRTGLYLESPAGEVAVNNILKMAREGLRQGLITALHKAVTGQEIVNFPGLRVKTNGDYATVNLTIRKLGTGKPVKLEAPLYLVILEQVQVQPSDHEPSLPADTATVPGAGSDTDTRIAMLQQELQAKEDYLQTANEELETSNEELKSSNEEMQSINEELQSANEELETSKEELQSVNEELATVNAELQTKVNDLSRANNDMNNLLAGTGIATLFVDHRLRILRFTPTASNIINLIPSDIGRPIRHIVSNLVGYANLVADTQFVLDTLIPKEVEVQTTEKKRFMMRILPYRTLDNLIEGAVITFSDITSLKMAEDVLRESEARLRIAMQAFPIVVFNQDKELRYTWILNPYSTFSEEKVLGKTDAELFPSSEANRLIDLKKRVLESGKGTRQEVRTTLDGNLYYNHMILEPLRNATGEIIGLTCALIDNTNTQQKNLNTGLCEGAGISKSG